MHSEVCEVCLFYLEEEEDDEEEEDEEEEDCVFRGGEGLACGGGERVLCSPCMAAAVASCSLRALISRLSTGDSDLSFTLQHTYTHHQHSLMIFIAIIICLVNRIMSIFFFFG